jgi:hypothetical protein
MPVNRIGVRRQTLRKRLPETTSDKINERLERDGMRTISLDDPEMVARYALEDLAKEAGYLLQ